MLGLALLEPCGARGVSGGRADGGMDVTTGEGMTAPTPAPATPTTSTGGFLSKLKKSLIKPATFLPSFTPPASPSKTSTPIPAIKGTHSWIVTKWLRKDLTAHPELDNTVTIEWSRLSRQKVVENKVLSRSRAVSDAASRGSRPSSSLSTHAAIPGGGGGGLRVHSTDKTTTLDPNNLVRRSTSSQPPSRPNSAIYDNNNIPTISEPKSRRLSTASVASFASSTYSASGSSFYHNDHAVVDPTLPQYSETNGTTDEGDESDPEDSERPWQCRLLLSPSPSSSESTIILATLIPTPHHPKLVARLSIPTSLSPLPSPSLSPEELKDLIAITCFDLVVREGMATGSAGKTKTKEGLGKGGRGEVERTVEAVFTALGTMTV